MKLVAFVVLAVVATASATIHFKETFDEGWQSRWVVSDWKGSEAGKWDVTAGEWYGDKEEDKGLRTTQDARFYDIAAKVAKPFSNAGKDLVIQFQVRFPQKIDCGGGYLKILASDVDLKKFAGDTKYNIMFGPDICGTSTKRVHVIFRHPTSNENLLIKKEVRAETDQLSHVYTLIVRPDNTYEVLVDGEKRESGSLYADWDIEKPKRIADPSAKKPSDWVDSPKMDDPTDTKPANWDDTPKEVPDPNAERPTDWDDDADGTWEAPTIPNPDYKGEWKPRQIDNPAYKGPWKAPEIDNPDYVAVPDAYKYDDFGAVGIDIWQVKAGTIFDNIIITDSVQEAADFRDQTWKTNKDAEKKMFDDAEAEKRKKEDEERKKVEEQRKKQDEEKAKDKSDDDDEDDDDDDKVQKKNAELHDDL